MPRLCNKHFSVGLPLSCGLIFVCLTIQASGDDQVQPAGQMDTGQQLVVLRDQVDIAGQQLGIAHLPQPQREFFLNDLRHLVVRCQTLELGLDDIDLKLQAASLVNRIHYLLALDASRQQDRHEASFRMGQLRAHCWQLKQHSQIQLQQQADHWLLFADLFDIQTSPLALDIQQITACARLERFLQEQSRLAQSRKTNLKHQHAGLSGKAFDRDGGSPIPADDRPDAYPAMQQAKLMLIQLYDQQGQSHKVKKWIKQMTKQMSPMSDLAADLYQRYRYVDFLDKPIDLSVTTVDGKTWRPGAWQGKRVLIVFDRPDQLNDNTMAPWLKKQGLDADAADVVYAVVGQVNSQTAVSSWPARTYIQADQTGTKLTHLWAIARLPRWALLNEQGHLVMIGSPPSIQAALAQTLGKERVLP